MFKKNRITLFCLIGSVFGVSLILGMVRSKPITSPSVNPPSTPPYKPLIAPTQANVSVSTIESRFIFRQFVKTMKLYDESDFSEVKDGSKKIVPAFKNPPSEADANSVDEYPNLIVDYCRDMAGSSSKYGFHQVRGKKYLTTDYLLTDDEYQQGKMICLKSLILYEQTLYENRNR